MVRSGAELASGADITATLSTSAGEALGEAKVTLAPGARLSTFEFPVASLAPGELVLRLRVHPTAGGLPMTETFRAAVADAGGPVGMPRLLRRGPSTGIQYVPTADPRFSRTERVRVELPVAGTVDRSGAELLDRTGKVMAIPVTTSVRPSTATEPACIVADLVLAPLAAGDYAVRTSATIGGTQHQVVTGFRVAQ
jgi:hypothetical protein